MAVTGADLLDSVGDIAVKRETTHRAEQELGPPVTAAGTVRWLSASAVVKADPNSEGGCLRRFWYHYVGSQLGISEREPETEAMSAGTEMHKEIETYLKTGNRGVLGPVAMSGIQYIPQPGPGLSIEEPIILGGKGLITGVWLRIAGVPYAGHLDLYNHRGEYIDAEGDLRRMAHPNTLEAKDWKSTSDLKWAKNPEQVANAIPMIGYAMAGFAKWPHYENVRLTHVYFQRGKKRASLLSTVVRPRAQVERRWEYATGIARSIVHAAIARSAEEVDCNTKACHSYGQLCPHFNLCRDGRAATNAHTLDTLAGPAMIARLAQGPIDPNELYANISDIFSDEEPMPILKDAINNNLSASSTPEADIDLDDLLNEEETARAAANQPKPMTPIEGWNEARAVIVSSPFGRPKLTGDAARMWCTEETDGNGPIFELVEGDGKLATKEISEPGLFLQLAKQISDRLAVQAAKDAGPKPTVEKVTRTDPAPATPPAVKPEAPPVERVTRTDPAQAKPEPAIALLANDAPASTPALAADPVEGLDNDKTRELATARAMLAEQSAAAAKAPKNEAAATVAEKPVTNIEALAAQAEADEKAAAAGGDAKPKARGGRPPGSRNKPKDGAPPALTVDQKANPGIVITVPAQTPEAVAARTLEGLVVKVAPPAREPVEISDGAAKLADTVIACARVMLDQRVGVDPPTLNQTLTAVLTALFEVLA